MSYRRSADLSNVSLDIPERRNSTSAKALSAARNKNSSNNTNHHASRETGVIEKLLVSHFGVPFIYFDKIFLPCYLLSMIDFSKAFLRH